MLGTQRKGAISFLIAASDYFASRRARDSSLKHVLRCDLKYPRRGIRGRTARDARPGVASVVIRPNVLAAPRLLSQTDRYTRGMCKESILWVATALIRQSISSVLRVIRGPNAEWSISEIRRHLSENGWPIEVCETGVRS